MPNGFYFFPGDYVRDTLHLSWFEDLAYRRLMDIYYSTGKPLRNDRRYLMRTVRATEPEEQAAVDAVLKEFFTLEADGWHQNKCDRQLVKELARSDGGKKGANARWHKNNDLGDSKSLTSHKQANAPYPTLPSTTEPPIYPPSGGEDKKRPQRKNKRPLPDGFGVSDRVRAWAEEHGFENVEEHLKWVIDEAKMKDWRYADWDLLLIKAMRENWSKLGDGRRKLAI